MTTRRIEPTRSLLQGAPYVHSTQTDIRVLFEQIKAELKKQAAAPNVSQLKRKTKP